MRSTSTAQCRTLICRRATIRSRSSTRSSGRSKLDSSRNLTNSAPRDRCFAARSFLEPASDVLPRVVGAAHQRSRLDVMESQRERGRFDFGELGRRYVASDGDMLCRRTQILAERQDVALDVVEIANHVEQLLIGFAQAEHHTRLGEHRLAETARGVLGVTNNVERALVVSAGPD